MSWRSGFRNMADAMEEGKLDPWESTHSLHEVREEPTEDGWTRRCFSEMREFRIVYRDPEKKSRGWNETSADYARQ